MRSALSALMTALLLLTGCAGGPGVEGKLERQRDALRSCPEIRFQAEVTGAAGDRVFTCTLDCVSTPEETVLTVASPESIAGITARTAAGETALSYDGVSLSLGASPGEDAPLSLLPTVARCLRQGHILRAWRERDGEQSCAVADIYVGEDRTLTVWFDGEALTPLHAALTVDGERVSSCEIRDFRTQ